MNISKVEVSYHITKKDERIDLYSITYFANEKGIVAEQKDERGCPDDDDELPTHQHILPPNTSKIQSINDAIVKMLVDVKEPDGLKLQVYDMNGICFIRKLWEFDQSVYDDIDDWKACENENLFDNKITSIINNLIPTHKRILKEIEIKDKECPVLHIALNADNGVKLRKCEHYISLEAWEKIAYTDGGSDGRSKKCPLCRAGHHQCEYD